MPWFLIVTDPPSLATYSELDEALAAFNVADRLALMGEIGSAFLIGTDDLRALRANYSHLFEPQSDFYETTVVE